MPYSIISGFTCEKDDLELPALGLMHGHHLVADKRDERQEAAWFSRCYRELISRFLDFERKYREGSQTESVP